MAKSAKPSGTSRIKLIVLDAEVADDQIHTLTQALTNALRGSSPPPARRLAPIPALNGHVEEPEESDIQDGVEDGEITELAPTKPRSTTPRKTAVVTPELMDIDFNSYEVPLATFAAGYKTDAQTARYLVACAWFQEHGDVTKVTPLMFTPHSSGSNGRRTPKTSHSLCGN
ncbi:hypothetical protein [Bradyrhizobium forestalis]|uniref:hypothetical protein n=1 Tax=Bradyrhizobium forestalis TaxID=1419263 RepID=UPI0011AF7AD5|nr:hypothetical protein [Bradyrhizobium forestalis]